LNQVTNDIRTSFIDLKMCSASFWVRLAWPKRPKIVCSPSYVDIRSRANTTMGLDFEHMIKARAHKGGVRIGKTPKKLASICCP
jgi:hypothetical protein